MSLNIKTEVLNGKQVFKLSGSIDEDVTEISIKPVAGKDLYLDLKDIAMINSIGIRTWCQWIQTLPQTNNIYLQHVPKVMVAQINAVKGFLTPNAHVQSVYLPLFCDKCDKQASVLIDCAKMKQQGFEQLQESLAAQIKTICTNASCEVEPDVNIERYFSFISR